MYIYIYVNIYTYICKLYLSIYIYIYIPGVNVTFIIYMLCFVKLKTVIIF